ncbi:MAG TPA: hypothetical protein VGB53_00720 [Rubricoccaceae bacterium]|jgi:hypothetical protein
MCLATAVFALVALAAPAAAQGRWLDTFAVPGASGGDASGSASVNAAVPDGAGVLVGGTFRLVDDLQVDSVARWTGTRWEAFGAGLRCTECGYPGLARVQAVAHDAAGAV